MISINNYLLFIVLLSSSFVMGCDNPTNITDPTQLNVDRDIPSSENFDASYGFWGPEGAAIYFTHSQEVGSDPKPGKSDQLWKLNLETGERTMISPGRILNADISPDGEWFVFQSFAVPQYLFKMRSDGTELTKLTGSDSPNPNWEYTALGRWSPNGNKILFSVSAGVPRGIALMDDSGADPNIIIPFGIDGKWFPGGSRIVHVNYDTSQVRSKQQQIYIANANGADLRKITKIPHSRYLGVILEPAVSPDGQDIAFANETKPDNSREIFIMDIDGDEIEQITTGPGFAARPEWSPDGQTILFSRLILNASSRLIKRLYYLDVNTHEVTPVFPATDE